MSPKAWRSISALFFLRVECNAGFLVGYCNLLLIFKKDLKGILFDYVCAYVALKAWFLENNPRALLRVAARKSCTVLGQVKVQDD